MGDFNAVPSPQNVPSGIVARVGRFNHSDVAQVKCPVSFIDCVGAFVTERDLGTICFEAILEVVNDVIPHIEASCNLIDSFLVQIHGWHKKQLS